MNMKKPQKNIDRSGCIDELLRTTASFTTFDLRKRNVNIELDKSFFYIIFWDGWTHMRPKHLENEHETNQKHSTIASGD